MNVILLERIGNLGDLGDEVAVRGGYARNYLIPTGRAVRATDANREAFQARRAELETAAGARLDAAEARGEQLADVAVTVMARASEEGKLYGSVGTADIAGALTERGVEISKAEVRLPDGVIRSVGDYDVEIQLHADVTRSVVVHVVAE